MSKLFKDNIIFHSAYRNQTTLVALFHLSAHVMLLQQHWEMKTNNVWKCLKGLTIFYKNRLKAELATYNQKMFFSPSQVFTTSIKKIDNTDYAWCHLKKVLWEKLLLVLSMSVENAKIHITVMHDCANQKNPLGAQLTYKSCIASVKNGINPLG